jgi:hypothetical protein
LPFSRHTPVIAVQLALTALVFWFVSAVYTVRFNPEIRFLAQMADLQARYAQKMDHEFGHKFLVVGGSSAMFSIKGEQMLRDHGLPVVNLGLNARLGPQVMIARALTMLNRGDTLVVAIEPGLFVESLDPPPAGIAFSCAIGQPELALAPVLGRKPSPVLSALLALRPGGDHVLILLSKLLTRKPLYYYSVAAASPSGWNHTDRRVPLLAEPSAQLTLAAEPSRFLHSLRDWCDARQIRVFYSLPWHWAPQQSVTALRKQNARLLLEIAECLPVLRDSSLGLDSDLRDFSDSNWHLNEGSSVLRSEQLAQQLVQGLTWPLDDLRALSGAAPDN